jgi:hypothetical protein
MSPGSSCYKSLIASCSTPFPKLPLLLSLGMWGVCPHLATPSCAHLASLPSQPRGQHGEESVDIHQASQRSKPCDQVLLQKVAWESSKFQQSMSLSDTRLAEKGAIC